MNSTQFKYLDNGRIETPGIDFAGPVTLVHQGKNNFAVWRKGSGSYTYGIGLRAYAPVEIWIIQVRPHYFALSKNHGHMAFILKKVEPGRKARSVMKEMIAECDRMAAEAK